MMSTTSTSPKPPLTSTPTKSLAYTPQTSPSSSMSEREEDDASFTETTFTKLQQRQGKRQGYGQMTEQQSVLQQIQADEDLVQDFTQDPLDEVSKDNLVMEEEDGDEMEGLVMDDDPVSQTQDEIQPDTLDLKEMDDISVSNGHDSTTSDVENSINKDEALGIESEDEEYVSKLKELNENENDKSLNSALETEGQSYKSKLNSNVPTISDLQAMTDELYGELDMEVTTKKEFVKIMEKRWAFGKLSKELRKAVKERLEELVETEVTESQEIDGKKNEADEENEDDESEVGDVDSDDESYNDEKETDNGPQSPAKKDPRDELLKSTKGVSHRRMMEIQREELRSLETQEQQKLSAADEARAKAIQARLDTTNCIDIELRGRVMQDLMKLRSEVLRPATERETSVNGGSDREDNSSSEEDDDDFELEITGDPRSLIADKSQTEDIARSSKSSQNINDLKTKVSPSKKLAFMNPRQALKFELRRKRIQASNAWLARELGYQDDQEHILECRITEQRRRHAVLQAEQEQREYLMRLIEKRNSMAIEEDEDDEEFDIDSESEEESSPGVHTISTTIPTTANANEVLVTSGTSVTPDKSSHNSNEIHMNTIDTDTNSTKVESTGSDGLLDENNSVATSQNETEAEGNIDSFELKGSIIDQMNSKVSENDVFDSAPVGDENNSEYETKELGSDVSAPNKDSVDSVDRAIPVITTDKLSANVLQQEKEKIVDMSKSNVGEVSKNVNTEEDGKKETGNVSDTTNVSEIVSKATNNDNTTSNKPRNAQWLAMLAEEKSIRKKQRNSNLIDAEAEEESDDEQIAGLEDFGFTLQQQNSKKGKNDQDEEEDDIVRASDLQGIVDDLSDNEEDDEEAIHKARMEQSAKEEKLRHKEMMRRMREGYEVGNRSAGNARGRMRYDQLISAGNREGAKRLGLLNVDEEDSSSDENDHFNKDNNKEGSDDEDDENAFLDKMLKDRFLPRHDLDPYLTDDDSSDDDDEANGANKDNGNDSDVEREKAEDLLAKRFSRRARMQRFLESIEMDSSSKSNSNSQYSHILTGKMIDEDETMKQELREIEILQSGILTKPHNRDRMDFGSSIKDSQEIHQSHQRLKRVIDADNDTINFAKALSKDTAKKCTTGLSIALRSCKGTKRQKRKAIF